MEPMRGLNRHEGAARRTLILVPPFTDFSKELAMGQVLALLEGGGRRLFSRNVLGARRFGSAQLGSV